MEKTDQFCPHCGGGFALDSKQPLQAYLTCPYCGSRSLMQKTANGIRLRGIIGSRPEPQDNTSQPEPAWPPPLPEAKTEQKPDLADLIAQADQDIKPVRQPEPSGSATEADQLSSYTELSQKMQAAAQQMHLPEFNSYSRLLLDQKPDDWQVYALRARLIEAASGLADKSWANPVWYLYTARQKTALLSRHFYAYNTALQYCPDSEKAGLATELAEQIVRQAVDHLTERATNRCSKRLFGRSFKGHYRRSDLEEAHEFCDAISRIDQNVSPLGHELLKPAIRRAAKKLPARLASRLSRF